MTLAELKAKYATILDGAKTANRSLSAAEQTELDTMKAEITALESNAQAAADAIQARNAAAAAANAGTPAAFNLPKNDYLRDLCRIALHQQPVHARSFTSGSADVGNKEVIADVVRVFEQQSPILAKFNNLQKRSTGVAFQYTKITQGSSPGYKKTEGVAGTADTTSTVTMGVANFKTYSGETVLVSAEIIADAVADIAKETIGLGMAKGTLAFDADCVTVLESAFGVTPTYPDSIGTTWSLTDLSNAYFAIPNRNRYGVKYLLNPVDAAAIVAQLTTINAAFTSVIGLDKDSIVVDQNVPAGVAIVGYLDLALAIGLVEPVRVWTQEVSAGVNIEAQPRFAVALRDGTALAARKLKTA